MVVLLGRGGGGDARVPGGRGQLPELCGGKCAAPVAAVVAGRPKSAPAPHALRFHYAVPRQEVVMVMVVVVPWGGGRRVVGRGD